mgnify:CR=1 FL=1
MTDTNAPSLTDALFVALDTLNSIAEEAGIEDFMTHNLRRTYISTLWDADVDAASVAQLAGHDSVDTSIKYDRRGRARLVAAAAKVPDPMQGGK